MMPTDAILVPLQFGIFDFEGSTRVDVFELIFTWFVVLGTLVGIVVISYMLWNAYKFRYTDDEDKYGDRPEMGEIPTGGGKGRKLFLSFGMSAIIVISLIAWTYGAVLYVEQPADQIQTENGENEEPVEITVTGFQFGWDFTYTNYDKTQSELVIPKDRPIALTVTSRDVFHNFGIPAFRIKTDAIPGEMTEAWFIADEAGTFQAKCYELCGAAHSAMVEDVTVMEGDEWEQWKQENLVNSSDSGSVEESTESDDQASIDVHQGARVTPGEIAVGRAGGLTS